MAISISGKLNKRLQHNSVLVTLILLILLVMPVPIQAAVSVDTEGFKLSSSDVNGNFNFRTLQPDGKIYIVGDFTEVHGVARNGFARLHADGSLDLVFDTNINGDFRVDTIQADGKIYIVGGFTQVDGEARNGFARLHVNGGLDLGFEPDINGPANVSALQPDGKILISGSFTTVDGIARNGFARINLNGSLDPGFDSNINGSASVSEIQSDGRILVSGTFTEVDGVARDGFARLNSDGSLDPGFDTNVNGDFNFRALQPDGKILIDGDFTKVSGVARDGFARLNKDGSLDIGFDPDVETYGRGVVNLLLQPDGKILIGGAEVAPPLTRLNADGSLDTEFKHGSIGLYVSILSLQPDGKILAGGVVYYSNYPPSLVRLKADGSSDSSFHPIVIGSYKEVSDIAVQPDGKILFNTKEAFSNNGIDFSRVNPDGTADSGFNPVAGVDGSVSVMATQPDGKILIGGSFTHVHGIPRNYIAQLNSDGSLDPNFAPILTPSYGHGGVYSGAIHSMLFQPDGKVLISGYFSSIDGIRRPSIGRLNPDGSLDTSFSPALEFLFPDPSRVTILAQQSDDKLLIEGNFGYSYNIVRLNADGSIDTSYDRYIGSHYEADAFVYDAALRSDGKLLIGGYFNELDGVIRNSFAQLNTDGSLDTSFDPPDMGVGISIYAILVQADGKIHVRGSFTEVDGVPRTGFARLNPDGTLDPGFNPNVNGTLRVNVIQPDSKMLVSGSFTEIDGVPRDGLARLNSDASLDTGFNPAVSGSVLTLQPDGKMLLSGGLIRLNADGSLDTSFYPQTGVSDGISTLALLPDGKINKLLIGGAFTDIDGVSRNHIARLNADRGVDTAFDPGTGANGLVSSLALQPDGKVLIGGEYTEVDGMTINYIARLEDDGTLDSSFDPGTGPNNLLTALMLQPDGKVLIGGYFTEINGVSRNRIARLNADGSLDVSFDPGAGLNASVSAFAWQSDGKILLGGTFTTVNGVYRRKIARLHPDGSLDTSFYPGSGADNTVKALAQQADGKVLIGGYFNNVGGIVRRKIARLNADGSVDTGFNPGIGANGPVFAIVQEANGKVLVGGGFTKIDDVVNNRVARLNTDGSLDTDFDLGTGANGSVEAIAIQGDGSIVIGGQFTEVNGIEQNYISRLSQNEAALQQLSAAVDGASVLWLGDGVGPVLERVTFEISDSLHGGWTLLGNGQRTTGGWVLDGLNFPVGQNIYLRARGYYGTNVGSITETIIQFYLEKPAILVAISANPSVLKEPGGEVTFTLTINNTSPTNTITIDTLTESIYGNLDGIGSCSVPKQIIAGKRYKCAYEGEVLGDAGFNQTHKATASGVDEYGNPVTDSDSKTVKIIQDGACLYYSPKDKRGMMICW